jgi:hypothetical protein
MASILNLEEAEYAVQLRMQRAIVVRVGAEIAQALPRVPASTGFWRSDAQRAYARRLGEVDDLLRSAWSALDAAVSEIDRDLAALAARAG